MVYERWLPDHYSELVVSMATVLDSRGCLPMPGSKVGDCARANLAKRMPKSGEIT
jgi:hypothetical protein